ncbi:MAG: DUF1549 domain-containing protein [Bacteroidota bacterium]
MIASLSSLWVFQLIGRLHPMLVHFPIGLLMVALFLELLTIRGKQGLREGIIWLVYLGALSAVISSIMGWLLASFESYGGALVRNHQMMGWATTVTSLLTAWLLHRAKGQTEPSYAAYRTTLVVTCIVLTITGHLGASMTHGEDYLTAALPGNKEVIDTSKTGLLLAEVAQREEVSVRQLDRVSLEVRAMFAHSCYQCHSEEKQEGSLRLDHRKSVFAGGESGPLLIVGDAKNSELVRRITLPRDHEEFMPKKGTILTSEQIDLISWWVDHGAHWVDGEVQVFPEAPLALSKVKLPAARGYDHPIDRLVNAYFESQEISWPEVVDDRTFMKRVYLDIVGLLPTPEHLQAFTADKEPDKRNQLVQALLNDNHNYAQHWISFWNDMLRNDYSGTGFITGGRKQITDWLYHALLDNKPYDQFVMELTNPTEASEGFIKGIEWRGVVNASQTTAMQAAQNIGQSLMGINVKCASCHNSFVSNLTLEQTYAFANIFSDSTLELHRCDKPTGKMAKTEFIYAELGSVEAETIKERLKLLSEVMVKPENGRLYRIVVNRIWERLNGRGIVEPVDEMDNDPWNGELLDWLASDFIDHHYDLKYLIENIMTSKAYQLPAVGYKDPLAIKTESYIYRGPVVRRLSAEQFTDAVSQVIKPVYASVAFDPEPSDIDFRRIWHDEIEFDRRVLPKPGKRYFRKAFTLTDKYISAAKFLVSVDHSYSLFVNGERVASGANWEEIARADVKGLLTTGDNVIAIEGENEGPIPNPAGILFRLKVAFEDGTETIIASDKSWICTELAPSGDWTAAGYEDASWQQVRVYPDYWGKMIDFDFDATRDQFARASLVKLDPYLKALGRPTRENVATTREEQASLLQALELTNGEFFNQVLEEGSHRWLQEYAADPQRIANELYLRCLGRRPSSAENEVILSALGDKPEAGAVQDLFWATLLLPEFQFIN